MSLLMPTQTVTFKIDFFDQRSICSFGYLTCLNGLLVLFVFGLGNAGYALISYLPSIGLIIDQLAFRYNRILLFILLFG